LIESLSLFQKLVADANCTISLLQGRHFRFEVRQQIFPHVEIMCTADVSPNVCILCQ